MFSSLRRFNKHFNSHWLEYNMLIILAGFVTTQLLVPLCTAGAGLVLRLAGIPYISYATIGLLLKRPLAIIGLLFILILMMGVSFFQYSVILIGMRDIRNGHYTYIGTIKKTYRLLRTNARIPSLLSILYLIFILPLAGIVYKANAFKYVQIPVFISDFLISRWYFALLLLTAFLVIAYLALRFVYVLPLTILKGSPMRKSFSESFRITHNGKWKLLLRVLVISIVLIVVQTLIQLLFVSLQTLFDSADSPASYTGAIIILSVSSIFTVLYRSRMSVLLMYSVIPDDFFIDDNPDVAAVRKHVIIKRIFTAVAAVLLLVSAVGNSALYTIHFAEYDTLVISHRGVDGKNGAQNTIPALIATIESAHPDYVETDVHETADGRFVIMHDENIYALTGINKRPRELTLDELTAIDVHENGFTAKIPSFDEYLETAERMGQKLMIELKTTSADSPDCIERFMDTYGEDIINHGHLIHSQDYDAMQKIFGSIKSDPMEVNGEKFFVSLILPLNLMYPETLSNAYTIEQTCVNPDFVLDALLHDQKIFVWTVNTSDQMDRQILLGADAIITDNPSLLRERLNFFKGDGKYQAFVEGLIGLDL